MLDEFSAFLKSEYVVISIIYYAYANRLPPSNMMF